MFHLLESIVSPSISIGLDLMDDKETARLQQMHDVRRKLSKICIDGFNSVHNFWSFVMTAAGINGYGCRGSDYWKGLQ